MHKRASDKAHLFAQTLQNPNRRVDVSLMETQKVQAEENREILRCIVLAVEYLAKQGLSYRRHCWRLDVYHLITRQYVNFCTSK